MENFKKERLFWLMISVHGCLGKTSWWPECMMGKVLDLTEGRKAE